MQRLAALVLRPRLNLLPPNAKPQAMGAKHNLGGGGRPMIRGDMTVTDFVVVLWNNKIKVMLLILAFAFGPGCTTTGKRGRPQKGSMPTEDLSIAMPASPE